MNELDPTVWPALAANLHEVFATMVYTDGVTARSRDGAEPRVG